MNTIDQMAKDLADLQRKVNENHTHTTGETMKLAIKVERAKNLAEDAVTEWEQAGTVKRRWIVGIICFTTGFILGAIFL